MQSSFLARWLHRAGLYVAIPLLVGIVSIDVLLRHVFSAPLLWGNEVSSLILLVAFFGSLPLCTEQRAHIRMALLHRHLGGGAKRIADSISAVSGLLFSAFLGYQSFFSAYEAYEFGDGAEFINFPYWPLLGFMGICMATMSLFFLGELWRAIRPPLQETA